VKNLFDTKDGEAKCEFCLGKDNEHNPACPENNSDKLEAYEEGFRCGELYIAIPARLATAQNADSFWLGYTRAQCDEGKTTDVQNDEDSCIREEEFLDLQDCNLPSNLRGRDR